MKRVRIGYRVIIVWNSLTVYAWRRAARLPIYGSSASPMMIEGKCDILPDLSDLAIDQVSITDSVTINAHATSPTATCPCCGTTSLRIHSHYTRALRDLPASGRVVHLKVNVRRFFCSEGTCQRKIFAERFPSS